jgi:hypothetical protein
MPDSAVLRGILKEVREKKILTPRIRSTLHSPTFKGFDIPVRGWVSRPPDGWWHPSVHATWPAEKLAQYLVEPGAFTEEESPLSFVLSVTQGSFWHEFLQRLLLDDGILIQDEVPLCDPLHRRKGHADGLLANGEMLEIKTASSRAFKKFPDAEALRENQPVYFAQTQDYLDMAEREVMRYLVMCKEPPYEFGEFLVRADSMFQAKQRVKYREAIDIARELMEDRSFPEVTSSPSEPSPLIPDPRPVLLYGTPLH